MSERIIGMIPGTGKQSQGIALRLAKAGYKINIGSRSKEKAEKIAEELNERIGSDNFKGFQNVEVVKKSNLLFFVIPYEYLSETIEELNPYFRSDTILVDVIVPLIFTKGLAFCSDEIPLPSISEFIQHKVPEGVSVVGAFKTISASKLNKINRPLNVDVFITSDNEESKKELRAILSKISGLRVLDAGPLLYSRTTEQMTAFVINLNKLNKLKHASFKVITTE